MTCSEGSQVGIVGWGWIGHTAGTAKAEVAQLIGKCLHAIC